MEIPDTMLPLTKKLTRILAGIILGMMLTIVTARNEVERKAVGQCFMTKGNPFVTLYCGYDRIIKIHKAFHGRHAYNTTDCTIMPQDCIEDQLNTHHYYWTKCMGEKHCVESVVQSWLEPCGNYSQYLQVEYDCIPETQVIDICSREKRQFYEGYIKSPGYPEMYPTSRDCECVLKSQPGSEFSLRVLDLTLEMRSADECADWLLLQSGRGKNKNTDLNCGEIMMNGKNVTIKSNTLNIHFHSDRYDNKSQAFSYNTVRKLKGFWIYLRAKPWSNITIECQPTKPKKLVTLRPDPTFVPSSKNTNKGTGSRGGPIYISGETKHGESTSKTAKIILLFLLLITTAAIK